MYDYTAHADHPAVRLLRLSFAFLMPMWMIVMYMPDPSWVLTFCGMIVMCNPVAWAELILDRAWPASVARVRLVMRRMPALSGRLGTAAAALKSSTELFRVRMRSYR
ncbi:hypothetical protein GGE65_006261 [Skermanella aerolata]|uniref:hypothetical protein n=1 Tax=Skermanella aerolata TaxID=393310 RepID=UPI003D21239E